MSHSSIRRGSTPVFQLEFKDKATARKAILTPGFDPVKYLEHQVNAISIDSGDPEDKLFTLFDTLTNHLVDLSNEIEDEAEILQEAATNMEAILFEELEDHLLKVKELASSVDGVKYNFEQASDNALKIGSRLQNSEKERLNIVKSMELLSYIHEFQNFPDPLVEEILTMNAAKLKKEILPKSFSNKDWSEISKIVHDLKKITEDLTSEDVLKAQKVINNISEVIENELLGQFDIILNQIMEANSGNIYGNPSNAPGNGGIVFVDEALIEKARALTECLHLFNNGNSLQKRYIFSVIQKRIPNNVYNLISSNNQNNGNLAAQIASGLVKGLNTVFNPNNPHFDNDDESSAGASDHMHSDDESEDDNRRQYEQPTILGTAANNLKPIGNIIQNITNLVTNKDNNGDVNLVDNLSTLFNIIDKVCREQFEVIRKIFPNNTIARVTRLLVQRIFGDPAFGIQAKVDAILCPQPPQPPLSTSDYLDALLTVREKLSALHLLLIECSLDPALMGMGSESESLRKAKNELWMRFRQKSSSNAANPNRLLLDNEDDEQNQNNNSNSPGKSKKISNNNLQDNSDGNNNGEGINTPAGYHYQEEEDTDEKLRSDAEIKEFLDEQINQVLATYMNDYFDKEITYVKAQYAAIMRKFVDDNQSNTSKDSKVNSGSLLTLPQLKAEKLKSIPNIFKTIGNKTFFNLMFNSTTDSLLRMESIGRDDKKLFLYLKNLYLLLLSFITEGIIYPVCKTCTTFLIKIASSKPNETNLPPSEFLGILVAVLYAKNKLKDYFEEQFAKQLKTVPNFITICKEMRIKSNQSIMFVMKESLHAWNLCVALHIEKLFQLIQSKFDYAPKFETIQQLLAKSNNAMINNFQKVINFKQFSLKETTANINPTSACNNIAKALIGTCQYVRNYEKELQGIQLDDVFWKPLGQQFVGSIISNIRRFKITIEGARILLRDLEEYHSLAGLMNSMETMDMMVCLIEICKIFLVDAEEVERIVVEELRHLDVAIVLGLVQCRADFNPKNGWAKSLSISFSNYRWETPLPWEVKKPLTIVSFTESLQADSHNNNNNNNNNSGARPLGPKTLRKEAATLSALYLSELASGNRQTLLNPNSADLRVSIDKNKVVQLDITLLEESLSNAELQKHIKAAELIELQKQQLSNNNHNSSNVTSATSAYFGLTPSHKSSGIASSSSFLPARPDEEEADRASILKRSSSSDTHVVTASVQRPDLIGIRPESLERTKSTNNIVSSTNLLSGMNATIGKGMTIGGGNAPMANGQGRKSEANMGVRSSESAATATLNATMKNNNSNNNPQSPGPTMGMLSKMSSFFSRK